MGIDALYGGWFLGGGGGGTLEGGLQTLETALSYGGFDVCSIEELPEDATVLTGSLVGSPSAGGNSVTGAHCSRAYELYLRHAGRAPQAIITNETGAQSISNGWIAASANHLPVLDGACNGRAHPTGVMGAMGLDTVDAYTTVQTAVGGSGASYLELCVLGGIESTSRMVRSASVQAGGFVTVLRNPVDAAFVRKNAALGALSMCMETGRLLRAHEGRPDALLSALRDALGLRVLSRGAVSDFRLECRGGFDVGSCSVGQGVRLTFWNEYMTVDRDGERMGTFPDLITLLRADSGLPVCSAQVRDGLDAILVKVPREKLLLGRAMLLAHLFVPCEEAVGSPIIPFVFGD